MTHQPATPGAAVAPPPGSSGEKIPCESDSGRPTSGTLVAPVFYRGLYHLWDQRPIYQQTTRMHIPIGWLYITYHLLREPETAIEINWLVATQICCMFKPTWGRWTHFSLIFFNRGWCVQWKTHQLKMYLLLQGWVTLRLLSYSNLLGVISYNPFTCECINTKKCMQESNVLQETNSWTSQDLSSQPRT